MFEIVHRRINGKEVSYEDIPKYKITNQIILDIVHEAIQKNNLAIASDSLDSLGDNSAQKDL